MGGKFLNPWSWKRKYLILAFGFRDWEGEKSLSSYKREPRVVCKTSWRKAFPRVSILAGLLVEREGVAFFSSGRESQGESFFFSTRHESLGARHVSQGIYFCWVVLFHTVRTVKQWHKFWENLFGHDFREDIFWGGTEIHTVCWAQKSRWAQKTRNLVQSLMLK